MSLTLAQAAEQVGLNRSTILRAVKSGKISGTRDDAGVWHVDPAELFRMFEPAQPEADAEPQHALTNALVAELRARLDDMRLTIEDVRRTRARRMARGSQAAELACAGDCACCGTAP